MALPRAVHPPLRYKARRAIEWFGRQSATGKKTPSPHGLGASELNSSEWASLVTSCTLSPTGPLRAYCAPAPNSANFFAVSVTMSILRCSLPCSSGMFTLSVTRHAADALHITVLHQFFQTPHYRNAKQLQ